MIILKVGRRALRTKLLLAAILLLLIAGATTMVYPFLLMTSGSTKSAVDFKHQNAIPQFWYDDDMLYRKHIEGLFNESVDAMNIAYGTEFSSFEQLAPPEKVNPKLTAVWRDFLKTEPPPPHGYACGYLQTPVSRTLPLHLRKFKRELMTESGDDIEKLNSVMGSQFTSWNGFYILPDNCLDRSVMPSEQPIVRRMWEYKSKLDPGECYYFSPEGFYRRVFLRNLYSGSIEKYNAACGTDYASFRDVPLHARVAAAPASERKNHEEFVRFLLNPLWIQLDAPALEPYRGFLREKYGDIAVLNKNYGTRYADFNAISLPDPVPYSGIVLSDYVSFLMGWQAAEGAKMHRAPLESLRVSGVDAAFRAYLVKRFGTVAAFNAATDSRFASFDAVVPPQDQTHYEYFLAHKSDLRREFTTRNFAAVTDYMLLHGRGIFNTIVYCVLSVLCALIFNPLAAYALSRFKLPATYVILMFLMLTMAFPAMVTQIPVFLTLRDMGLLNSFAALILPGLANGFSIFLLKGFFDSLPKELYESASLDGASEWTIFWQITMSLSKPILAVIALGAFTAAYSNFMFALLICQDESMWTMMVWLYQLQQNNGEGVLHASLLIAAIPMLLIFVFCQNIIMRGIVVPTEK